MTDISDVHQALHHCVSSLRTNTTTWSPIHVQYVRRMGVQCVDGGLLVHAILEAHVHSVLHDRDIRRMIGILRIAVEARLVALGSKAVIARFYIDFALPSVPVCPLLKPYI